jgi:hypothetical protein
LIEHCNPTWSLSRLFSKSGWLLGKCVIHSSVPESYASGDPRSLHQRAIRIDDAVAGIFPSHVLITDWRSRLILLKAITIAVSILIDPR